MTDIEQTLFTEFWTKLCEATDIGIAKSNTSYITGDFYHELQHNNAVFAAFKTHRMGKDMSKLLLDSNGVLKPFEQWVTDVRPIADHQVYNWFKTEYVTAVNRARHAANWKEFQRTSEALPNLKWRPSTAASPREIHAVFYGLVLPINHPFWHQHSPGDNWNCQCGLLATDQECTPENKIPESGYTRSKGLDNNPADDAKLFNNTHPYFPSSCKGCKFNKSKGAEPIAMFLGQQKRDCYECQGILSKLSIQEKIERRSLYKKLLEDDNYTNVEFDHKSGGLMATHIEHNLDPRKGHYEVNTQKAGYNAGYSVILEKEDHTIKYHRNTEGLWNGKTFEIKACETGTIANIVKGLKHSVSKNAEVAVLYFVDNFDVELFEKAIARYNGLHNDPKQWKKFEYIICVNGENIVYKKSHL